MINIDISREIKMFRVWNTRCVCSDCHKKSKFFRFGRIGVWNRFCIKHFIEIYLQLKYAQKRTFYNLE